MKKWGPATEYHLQISTVIAVPALTTSAKRTTSIALSLTHLLHKAQTANSKHFFVPDDFCSAKLARSAN
jgi:hypothetical protein